MLLSITPLIRLTSLFIISCYYTHTCSQEDAFASTPIDGHHTEVSSGWTPPLGSSIESIQKWEKEYQSVAKMIAETTLGGEELREFAKTEIYRLRQLRHELFCED